MNQPIGILDSGLGGYSVFSACTNAFPKAPFIFLADQKHAPYGSKSKAEIIAITQHNVEWFINQGITDILFACNTATSVALMPLKQKYPEINLIGIIQATVQAIRPYHSIAVLATTATVNTLAYTMACKHLYPFMLVNEIDGENLVALIEGLADRQVIKEKIIKLLYSHPKPDALVLGCTHYPIIADIIKEVWDIPMIDSLAPIVSLIRPLATHRVGLSHLFTTADANHFQKQIKNLFNDSVIVHPVKEKYEF